MSQDSTPTAPAPPDSPSSPLGTFAFVLGQELTALFKSRPEEYSGAISQGFTPESLADKMALRVYSGGEVMIGESIRRTCKRLGLRPTNAAIKRYLHNPRPSVG